MNKNDVIKIIEILKNTYPNAKCSLNFNSPFELGIAVMLSAQCTDERVNMVTPNLFKAFKTPIDFANADIKDIENLIRSCGFYKAKAKNIKLYSQKILEEFNGILPEDEKKLVTLSGIGRKSANVIMLETFNKPVGIAVDTHVKRLSGRIGLSKNSDPLKIEQDLIKIIPKKYFKDVNHIFIYHGRNICKAQNPKCEECPIKDMCNAYKKKVLK